MSIITILVIVFLYIGDMNHNFSKPQLNTWLDEGWSSSVQLPWSDVAKTLQSWFYHSSSDDKLSIDNRVWRVRYRWSFDYTLAYPDGAKDIYQQQWVCVIECSDWEEITLHLKQYFDSYKAQFGDLRELNNWKSIPQNMVASYQLSYMIHHWSGNFQMPSIWYMKKWETKLSHSWETLAAYVPYALNGKLIRIRNVGMASKVSLDTPDDRACLVALPITWVLI